MVQDLLQIPRIREWLAEPDFFGTAIELAEKYNIPGERSEEFLDLADAVVRRQIPISDMPSFIEKAFGIDGASAKKLATDLAGHRLLPLVQFLPEIETYIKQWGGNLKDYPDTRIDIEKELTETAAERILDRYNIQLPPDLMNRFEYIVQGFIAKDRSEQSTLTFLQRPSNIGGLEMDETAAKNLLGELKREQQAVQEARQEDDREEVVQVFNEQKRKRADATVAKLEDEIHEEATQDLRNVSRQEELNAHSEPERKGVSFHDEGKVAPPPASAPGAPTAVKPEPKPDTPPVPKAASKPKPSKESLPAVKPAAAVTKEVPVMSGTMMSDDEEQDIKQATKQLSTPGAGQPTDHPRVKEALEPAATYFVKKKIKKQAFEEIANAHVRGLRDPLRTEQIMKDKFHFTPSDIDEVMASLEKARAVAQGYHDLPPSISPAKKPVSERETHVKREEELMNKRHASMTQAITSDSAGVVAPTARVSAARSKDEELTLQESQIDETRVAKAKEQSRPQRAKMKLSKPTSEEQGQKKVTDIVYQQRLMGPVQELGSMGPKDFRRISSDPEQGAKRIMDKLNLLESTSYEERVKGVKAWRQSPMNKLYVAMAREALQKGQSIQEVATSRRNAGEESLSPAEIQALLKLNAMLKF